MVTTSERTRLREELVGQGYSWEYVDGWPPKINLYRHAPIMSESGNIITPVGTKVVNLPGNPDYVMRKSRLGMLPYPPSETCVCRWCAARNVHAEPVTETGKEYTAEESVACQECGEEVTALTKAGALSRLRVHMKTHQVSE
jgi:hypothetical protein